ncbi:methyltransferase family protein [Streptococcus chenjunshii]|nr:isoprenylcysteine carboxylmethyltransferase family protein [Streptococcus chenjunshii]
MLNVSFLELKIPPLLLCLITGLLMKILASFWPFFQFSVQPFFVFLFAAAGSFIIFLASHQFNKQQASVNPLQPMKTAVLARRGIYRFSRNPMYLGMTVLLFAWGIYLQAVSGFLGVLLFVLYLTQFQIKPEERFLFKKFGPLYQDYCQQTRRWL